MITEFVAAWIAVSAGISPSTVWNAANLSPLTVLPILVQITVKQTPTYIERLKLEGTVKESPKEPCEWESMSETAQDLKVLMLTPDGTQLPVS